MVKTNITIIFTHLQGIDNLSNFVKNNITRKLAFVWLVMLIKALAML